MKKVLRVTTRLNIGGPSKQILTLNSLFDGDKYRQLIVAGRVLDSEIEIELSDFDRVIKLDALRRGINPINDVKVVLQLMVIIKKYQPDIIHTHLSKAWAVTTFARILIRSKSKSVHTFHGHILHSYFSSPVAKVLVWIQKILAVFTDVLVAVNPIVRDELIQKGIGRASKFLVVHPGFDACPIKPKAIARFNLGLDSLSPVIGYIGRFEPIKRPDILREVVNISSELDKDIQFLICGGGSLYSTFQETTRDHKVCYLGWTKNLTDFYSSIDLLILTSDNEGSPLAIIEGGLLGIPTLARNVGGINSLIQDNFNGFLSGDKPSDIAEKLKSILKDISLLQDVSRNVEIDFKMRFNATDFLQKYDAIYSG